MKPIEILVFGKNENILQTVLRLINKNEAWNGVGTTDDETLIEKIQYQRYDLLLLGGGIPAATENKIRALVKQLQPNLKVVQHFGGGSGLLSNEIQAALDSNKVANFNIIDNPL